MSTVTIDPTACVSPRAELETGVRVGPYSVIEDEVHIGAGTFIGPHCLIQGPSRIGAQCTFTGYASIGTPPQDHSYRGEKTSLVMGDHNTVREFATINRGTLKDKGITRVGSGNLIMAYAHVAHDCIVEDHIVMGNLATLAGHAQVGHHAIIGGLSAVHQFTRIGAYAILGGGSMVSLDIVPFAKASGNRARLFGLNSIGLKRNGFTPEAVRDLRQAFRLLFQKGLLLAEALSLLSSTFPDSEHIAHLIDFIECSKRGIAR